MSNPCDVRLLLQASKPTLNQYCQCVSASRQCCWIARDVRSGRPDCTIIIASGILPPVQQTKNTCSGSRPVWASQSPSPLADIWGQLLIQLEDEHQFWLHAYGGCWGNATMASLIPSMFCSLCQSRQDQHLMLKCVLAILSLLVYSMLSLLLPPSPAGLLYAPFMPTATKAGHSEQRWRMR